MSGAWALESGLRVRLDKWLWAARFFNTRSQAAQAVDGGRIRVNGNRVKPAREVHAGDEIVVHVGELEWVIRVKAVSGQRRPAPQARLLYAETPESLARRLEALAARKAQLDPVRAASARPSKRDRRMIRRFTEG